MNPFEKFSGIPAPDGSIQFEAVEHSEKNQLVSEAIIKLEGVVMYSTELSSEAKGMILKALEEVPTPSDHELNFFFEHEQRGTSLEQTTALWISRKMRGLSNLNESDSAEFSKIVHNLYV